MPTFWGYFAEYAAVVVIGAGVGLGEMVSRYRDQPSSAVTSIPGIAYIAINGAASAGALALTLSYSWNFGTTGESITPTRILVTGFGAMALFRSSLFKVRVGERDVDVGPSSFLTMILASVDRAVDRVRAADRAQKVQEIMKDVSFAKAEDSLPTVALGLMQNLDPTDQAALGVQLEKVRRDTKMSDHAKALLLGLALDAAVGPEVLEEAKMALGEDILRLAQDDGEGGEVGSQDKPSPAAPAGGAGISAGSPG